MRPFSTSIQSLFRIDRPGGLQVIDSSTVICLRRVPGSGAAIPTEQFPARYVDGMLESRPTVEFNAGWQVLLGQSEIKNWLRSTAHTTVTMRYGGEFKFAGGTVDSGETIRQAGLRELREEFLSPAGVVLPDDAVIRPFSVKQTMPVRSKSNVMFNFVALASENEWLATLDLDALNHALAKRRNLHASLVASGEYWTMSDEQKELVAPEVHAVSWVPLHDAFTMSLTSMNEQVQPINEYQRVQFDQFAVQRRDPMFMTAVTIFEIEAYPSEQVLGAECPVARDLGEMRHQMQWLFNGFTNSDLQAATETPSMIKRISEIEELRRSRLETSINNTLSKL